MITVDRIEGDRAVLDVGGEQVDFPARALPRGAREGSVLQLQRAPEAEQRILDEAKARLARLAERDPGKDEIEL